MAIYMIKYYKNKTRESIMSKVALKPLDTRSRTIISVSLFVVVFTILITLASIFDFQVSQIPNDIGPRQHNI